MSQQNKNSKQINKTAKPPQSTDVIRNKQRQKAEEQEVAGRHKNDGQKGHKGRR